MDVGTVADGGIPGGGFPDGGIPDGGIPSSIFCEGPILAAFHEYRVFEDSKTFVDMHLKADPEKVLERFETLMENNAGVLNKEILESFLKDNFDPPESELEEWTPHDWRENPEFLQRISDAGNREWAKEINNLWRTLGRKVTDKVKKEIESHPERYTLIPVPNGFIVPGDRFREIYYWDTYWIIKGLLVSDMTTTAREMISNLLYLVDKFGKVPNGTRIYFLNRSQPPLLTMMMEAYYDATNDLPFVKENIELLTKEYNYWLAHHTVEVEDREGRTHHLARYLVKADKPRPESYKEDLELAREVKDKPRLYRALSTAAESGWDFSTRWYGRDDNGEPLGKETMESDDILPVDLNVFLGFTENILARFYSLIGEPGKSEGYKKKYRSRLTAIDAIFKDDVSGVWFDYHIKKKAIRKGFYISNIFPLLFEENRSAAGKVVSYLKELNVLSYPAGIPTSLRESGEQWDFPNVWPPTIDLAITALEKSKLREATVIAEKLKADWLKVNKQVWDRPGPRGGFMFEKYNVNGAGEDAGGGEYVNQKGFGWSNGVVLQYLIN